MAARPARFGEGMVQLELSFTYGVDALGQLTLQLLERRMLRAQRVALLLDRGRPGRVA